MEDGSAQKNGSIHIATNNFTYQECLELAQILKELFNLKVTVISAGKKNQWRLNIWKESIPI
jgi:DNA-binding transcriptional regulator LsrR (DeoR family)